MTRLSDVSEPEVENDNCKVVRFGVSGGGKKLAKKSGKLKGQNLAKSQKLSKLGKSKSEKSKKQSKNGNLHNFNTTKANPSFLTLGAREIFNRL